MDSNKNFIYCIRHPDTLEIRYIGQTSQGNSGFRQHISNMDRKQPVSCFIRSLIKQSKYPIFEILEYCNKNELDIKEEFYIFFYRKFQYNLLNLTNGGSTTRGYKMPREIVERIRKLNKGRPSTFKGKHHTEENKKLASERMKKTQKGSGNGFFGKKHTEETKRKIGFKKDGTKKGGHSRKSIICLNTGIIYASSYDAAEKLNLKSSSIRSVLQGKSKALRGLRFNYV